MQLISSPLLRGKTPRYRDVSFRLIYAKPRLVGWVGEGKKRRLYRAHMLLRSMSVCLVNTCPKKNYRPSCASSCIGDDHWAFWLATEVHVLPAVQSFSPPQPPVVHFGSFATICVSPGALGGVGGKFGSFNVSTSSRVRALLYTTNPDDI